MSSSVSISPRFARGFTLVEMLVVIGIIGVLVGILLPVMSKARHQAMSTVCQSNLSQIYKATVMYGNDNRDRWPGPMTTGNHIFRRAPGDRDPNDPTYPEVLGLAAVLHGLRESDKAIVTGPLDLPKPRYLNGRSGVWICPAADETIRVFNNTYAFSIATLLERDSTITDAAGKPQIGSLALTSTKRRNTQHIANGQSTGSPANQPWVFDNVNTKPGICGKLGPFGSGWTTGTTATSPYVPHRMGARGRGAWYLYVDGHTEFKKQADL